MSTRSTEPRTELDEQDMREMESPEVACAVDALLDFMEYYPETWGRKPVGSIVPLIKRHYDSAWLQEYLSSFLTIPFFVEAPEIRAWLMKSGILLAGKGNVRLGTNFMSDVLRTYTDAQLSDDLQSLRKSTQDEILERVRAERPEMVAGLEEMFKKEDAQFVKTAHIRDLVFKKCIQWMKKNEKWIMESPSILSELPQVLSVTCSSYAEIEVDQLLEELKMRQYVEIAPLEPEETDDRHTNEVVWHMDHLELKPRRYEKISSFSCGRFIILLISVAMMISTFLQLGGAFYSILNPYGPKRS